jgi:hypothetical protein
MHTPGKNLRHGRTCIALALAMAATVPAAAADLAAAGSIVTGRSGPAAFPLVHEGLAVPIFVDETDHEAVRLAAVHFRADIGRVTGKQPALTFGRPAAAKAAVIAGTLGKSALIDDLVGSGKIKTDAIAGKWESFQIATIPNPLPGIEQALVIVGSDRRGTIYGLYELSEQMGVSPWYYWADVPVRRQEAIYVKGGTHTQGPPAVKYRGIFINDEDWGLHQWALNTLEPESRGIGPKTYEKVYELMLRLRLNYLWPAMHEVTREFHNIPENVELAHRYGIVAGSSHCEPMLFNNAKWNERELGRWDYTLNEEKIHAAWENSAKTRGDKEAVWTLGIRGIHDRGMQGPNNTQTRIGIVSDVFQDQRALLKKYVTKDFGPVAQCFVPYKEVLTLYDAGLKVPDDVTLMWVDDNFGYIRRLGAPAERHRPGGAGVYWHQSYYGGPHSYLWINTTAPALMWEELHKAWENDARTMWVINVGDIKPMEIGMDYFSKFAWNPEAVGPDSQPRFLHDFAARQFGEAVATPVADLLGKFYRLGTVRKPELMTRAWAVALPEQAATDLRREYESLLGEEEKVAASIPAESRDAYFEMVGFPARVLAASGLTFMADRAIQLGEAAGPHEQEITRRRDYLEQQVDHFNNAVAGGKWKHMMPGLVTARNLTAWNSQVRWPWGERPGNPPARNSQPPRTWRDAAAADRQSAAANARWTAVAGLGHTGRALALKPAGLDSAWQLGDTAAPALEFEFETAAGHGDALIDFLPTFRIAPGMQLRVAVGLDDQPPIAVEVPGSSGREDEGGPIRSNGVQDNFVRARVPLSGLTDGKHVLRIRAVDPGVVIDRVSLPAKP